MELEKPASENCARGVDPATPVRAADAARRDPRRRRRRGVFGLPGGPISPAHRRAARSPRDPRRQHALRRRGHVRRRRLRPRFGQARRRHGDHGPGVLNAMTGLTSAYCDGLPVLLLAGEVAQAATSARGALQDGSVPAANPAIKRL